jgi:hypothetical protein
MEFQSQSHNRPRCRKLRSQLTTATPPYLVLLTGLFACKPSGAFLFAQEDEMELSLDSEDEAEVII